MKTCFMWRMKKKVHYQQTFICLKKNQTVFSFKSLRSLLVYKWTKPNLEITVSSHSRSRINSTSNHTLLKAYLPPLLSLSKICWMWPQEMKNMAPFPKLWGIRKASNHPYAFFSTNQRVHFLENVVLYIYIHQKITAPRKFTDGNIMCILCIRASLIKRLLQNDIIG